MRPCSDIRLSSQESPAPQTEGAPLIHACECATCQAGVDPETARYHHQVNVLLSRLNEAQRRWHVALLAEAGGAPSER